MRPHHRELIVVLIADTGPTNHANVCNRAFKAKVTGVCTAAIQSKIASDPLKAQAFVKHVTEIQLQAPRQGRNTHQPQQPAAARFDLKQLAVLDVYPDLAG